MSRPGLARAGSSIAVSDKTIVLVTAGDSGLGFHLVQTLAASHPTHQILLGTPNTSLGEQAAASMGAPTNVNPIQLDLADDVSIENCVRGVEQLFGRLDCLVCVGGDGKGEGEAERKGTPGREEWSKAMNGNVVGTALLMERLVGLFGGSRQPRVVFVGAGGETETEKVESGNLPYASSMAAANVVAADFRGRYEGRIGVHVLKSGVEEVVKVVTGEGGR